MYEVSSFDHMNAKVDTFTQKVKNITLTPAIIVDVVTPNSEIYGVPGHVTVDCQLLVEPTPY